MSSVRIPPVLRAHTGGSREVTADGDTVGTVLDNLTEEYPGLREQLFEGGTLQRYVNVYVNDEDIQYLEKLATPVGPKDTVVILPAMAGG
jgi:molybdopterin converting factor small subunit